jgi:ribosomal-protein-alanine N-acetyltransferase
MAKNRKGEQMNTQPEITTERLLLRPFTLADAPAVQKLAGDKAVASMTLNIPHPYEDGMAEAWIDTHPQKFERGEEAVFAIVLREDDTLMGAIGLTVNQEHERAEMGYWIGKPYRGNGYCTEAAKEVVKYGFTALGLTRIQATHFVQNPASGRVMEKIGMTYEGCLRQYVKKWGDFIDLKMYAILKAEYKGQSQT